MDVDTRLLRHFAAVAQEGTLTRAAGRVYVTQPALTRSVHRLEELLGVRLFTRSKTGMTLTAAGEALAARVPGLLGAWDDVTRATRTAAAREARVLRVGFLASAANEATPAIVAAFARRRPDWRVEMRQSSFAEPDAGLGAGEVDVALVRMPFPGEEAWTIDVLFTEPRVLAMAASHPLAGRDRIAFTEVLDEPFVAAPESTGAWRGHWLAVEDRGGRPVRVGAVTETPDDWLSAIANGYGVALAPESATRFYARPGVVHVPVDGVGPSTVGVARADAADQVVRDFVACCLAAF